MKRWMILLLCQAAVSAASAMKLGAADYVCPIDGERFQAMSQMSGTSFGTDLDLRPYGALMAPWPLPKCPTSGFVMFKAEFSPEELARLRAYVQSDEYKVLKSSHGNYFLSARLRAQLGETPAQLANTLLRATWEAGSSALYEQYAAEALAAYEARIAQGTPGSDEWLTGQTVAGELERRLGRFDAARARFQMLGEQEAVKSGAWPWQVIRELQLRLIEAGDRRSHRVPQKSGKP